MDERRGLSSSWIRAAAAAALLLAAGYAHAQDEGPEPTPSSSPPAQETGGASELTSGQKAAAALTYQQGRVQPTTPRGAFRSYLTLAERGKYADAEWFFALEPGLEEEGSRLARQLHTVLERRLPVNPETLSSSPAGSTDDGLAEGIDLLGRVRTKAGEVSLFLERVETGQGQAAWKLSSGSVSVLDEIYEEVRRGPLAELFPESFQQNAFLDVQLWQWIMMVGVLLVAWLLSWPLAWLAYKVLSMLTSRTKTMLDDQLLEGFIKPARFLFLVLLFAFGVGFLQLESPGRRLVMGLCTGLAVIAVAWMVNRFIGRLSEALKTRLVEQGKASLLTLVPLGQKTAQALVIILAFLFLLQNLGLNVTGLIAGLGIGGLAVALAAQKTIENFFGGLSIIADQPVRVGDFIKFGDQVGIVEDIGIRSTKIRSLDRTLIAIPNADFSSMKLENFAHRDMMRFYAVIGVRYETSPDQMRYLLVEIRRMLYSHPRVTPEPARIRFVGFGDFSLNLEIFAYVDTKDWNEFLGIREDLLLRIMDIVEASGSGFAFPSNTTYLARDEGLNKEAGEKAQEHVQKLRDEGQLPLPVWKPETIAEIDDTIEWPPPGHVKPPPSES